MILLHIIKLYVGAVSIVTLLIGYYHGLLLRDIDADLLTNEMCSTGLFTADALSLISSGHNVHHRNWLLLEHVRHFEVQQLLVFCKLVKEEWVEIGSQLTAGMRICSLTMYVVYCQVDTFMKATFSHTYMDY